MPVMDFKARHEAIHKAVMGSQQVSKSNKMLFDKYRKYLLLQNYSPAHIQKVLSHLKVILENIDFDLEKATQSDVEGIVTWVQARDVADATMRQYKIVLKMVFKWLNKGEYPKSVKWINTSPNKNKETKPTQMYTEEEVIQMLEACTNPRDKAIVSLLWETGARMGEVIDLKIGDFEDTEHGLKIVIKGKTGSRRLPLISSVPHLRAWIYVHPHSNDPNAPMWVNVGTVNNAEQTGYRAIVKALEGIGKRAGLSKPMNPHHFRHSRATYLANKFTEAQMNEWFGWVQGSGMPANYVLLSGRDIDSAYSKLHGIVTGTEPEKSRLSPEKCPRCRIKVAPGSRYCYQCGMTLNLDDAMKMQDSQEKAIEALAGLKDEEVNEWLGLTAKMVKIAKNDPEVMKRIMKGKV